MDDIFTAEQLAELRKPLDRRLISERKGGHGKVKYLQGRVVIDQADRIFGYGCWATTRFPSSKL
jgi:recombination DNA repair RAD52 pathway protein